MAKKLFTVTVEYELVVLADDVPGAIDEALDLFDLDHPDGVTDPMVDARELKETDPLPDGWGSACLPFGEQDAPEKTIGDFQPGRRKGIFDLK